MERHCAQLLNLKKISAKFMIRKLWGGLTGDRMRLLPNEQCRQYRDP